MPNVCKNVVIEPHLAWDLGDRIHYLCGAFCSSVCLQGKPAKTLIFPFLFFSSSKFPVFFFFLTRCTTAFQGFVVSVFRVEQIGAKKKKSLQSSLLVDHVALAALYLFIYFKHENVNDGVQLANR